MLPAPLGIEGRLERSRSLVRQLEDRDRQILGLHLLQLDRVGSGGVLQPTPVEVFHAVGGTDIEPAVGFVDEVDPLYELTVTRCSQRRASSIRNITVTSS